MHAWVYYGRVGEGGGVRILETTLIIHTLSRLVTVLSNACMDLAVGGLQCFTFVSFATNLLMKHNLKGFFYNISPSFSFTVLHSA